MEDDVLTEDTLHTLRTQYNQNCVGERRPKWVLMTQDTADDYKKHIGPIVPTGPKLEGKAESFEMIFRGADVIIADISAPFIVLPP